MAIPEPVFPVPALEINDIDFNAMRKIMYERTGVYLKPTKKPLMISRLRKRLISLHLTRFSDYTALLMQPASHELENFVNAITTNETYFFRHARQFTILREEVLPLVLQRKKEAHQDELRIWSAACATGEEPYSIAITCEEFSRNWPGLEVTIFASDINSEVLDEAQQARYTERSFRGVPDLIRTRYFTRHEEGSRVKKTVFVLNPALRKKVVFVQHNLLKPFMQRDLDIIFLRNVLIYFDQASKAAVVKPLQDNVRAGGYLFTSLSESLNDVPCSFKFIKYGVYEKY